MAGHAQPGDEIDIHDFERLVMEQQDEPGVLDAADIHPIQLMCFESYLLDLEVCRCHGFGLRNLKMAYHSNKSSFIAYRLWEMFADDFSLDGVYFVTHGVCSMFTEMFPLYIDKLVNGVRGMLIHVPPWKRWNLVYAVGRLGELGASPCHYLRRVDPYSEPQVLRMFTDDWVARAVDTMYNMQLSERDRLLPFCRQEL
ncbi:ORF22 [Duck adenovirus 4]|uniref:ORF22 n=1 Tax=Duck adenovirus 4 TaxID=2726020 RepID=A0A6M3QJ28_9ADEN|nr:ORF22 [Duck adenovirus 4]